MSVAWKHSTDWISTVSTFSFAVKAAPRPQDSHLNEAVLVVFAKCFPPWRQLLVLSIRCTSHNSNNFLSVIFHYSGYRRWATQVWTTGRSTTTQWDTRRHVDMFWIDMKTSYFEYLCQSKINQNMSILLQAIDLEPIDFEHFIDEPELGRPDIHRMFRQGK